MKNIRFCEIDLLRLVAALSVVAFHYTYRGAVMNATGEVAFPVIASASKYGYLGVHLFFVISGLVILFSADGKSARQFVTSRISRLYPAYWCCVTITFVSMVVFGRGQFTVTAGQYLANLTMLNSFFGIDSIDGAYWSLAVEMKFYLLVLILIAFNQIRHINNYLGAWLAMTLWFLDHHVPLASGFLIAPYAGCFIAGATLYLIAREGNSLYKTVLLLGSFYAVQVRAVRATVEAAEGFLALGHPLVITLTLGAIFLVMYLIVIRATSRFTCEKFAFLGALTYPLYLLHENLGFLVFAHLGRYVEWHVLLLGLIGVMLAASWWVHRFIECRVGPRLRAFLNGIGLRETKSVPRLLAIGRWPPFRVRTPATSNQ